MAQEDLFAAWSIKRGCRRKYDVDCKPFLEGDTVAPGGFVITPPAGCPVTFEPVSLFEGNTVAQFYANAPDDAAFGYYRCEVKITTVNGGGESDKQYFQMRVE